MIYLVSYNHSGNTWIRYCVEYLTKKPTWGHRKFSISERNNNILKINIKDKPILIKRHEIKKNEITYKDTFILILRKPNECIKEGQNIYREFLKYYVLIEHYKKHKGRKLVLHYNELFNKSILSKFINKYNTKNYEYRLKDLKLNWKQHQKICLSLYNNKVNQRNSNLKDIPEILLTMVNNYVK